MHDFVLRHAIFCKAYLYQFVSAAQLSGVLWNQVNLTQCPHQAYIFTALTIDRRFLVKCCTASCEALAESWT